MNVGVNGLGSAAARTARPVGRAGTTAGFSDFAVETATFGGPLPARLEALRRAGFTQAVLSARELVDHAAGVDAALAALTKSGVAIAGFTGLHDFEGLTGARHAHKVDVAQRLLALSAAAGCRLLLVEATTAPDSAIDLDALARDLRKLALLAVPQRIRIGYVATPAARRVRDAATAWDVVCRADMPNLGLVVDATELLASASMDDDLELLDPSSVLLVRLADRAHDAASAVTSRLFPGEGVDRLALAGMVARLAALGYRGLYSLAATESDFSLLPPAATAERARRSAAWLADDVLRLRPPSSSGVTR